MLWFDSPIHCLVKDSEIAHHGNVAFLTSQRVLPGIENLTEVSQVLELFLQRRGQNHRLAYYRLEGRNMKALRIITDYNWAWKFHLPGFTRRFPGMVKFMQHGILLPHHATSPSFSTSWSTRTQSWRCGHEKSPVRDLVTRNRYCAFYVCFFFDVVFPRYENFFLSLWKATTTTLYEVSS